MRRRKFITSSSAGVLAMTMPIMPISNGILANTRFGVAEASYLMRWYRKMDSTSYPPFTAAIEMVEHCGELGFGGVQVGIRNWDKNETKHLRNRSEALEMFLEGQIKLPKDEQDTARFEADILSAKAAGISVVRTACLSGRRYETFDTLDAFKTFKAAAIRSIELAVPIVRKHKVKLAVENHKDWRINEFLEILKNLGSEWVGITLDTGNNISLLEDPMKVVKELAPYSFSVHLKDMAVAEYEDGFLMSEVNLGEGYLDIERMIKVIKKEQPDIRFNLEMITRDPLKIPCLKAKYWATFEDIPAKELGTYLHSIRSQKSKYPLPHVSDKSNEAQLALEVENNRTSLMYAKQNLGFN